LDDIQPLSGLLDVDDLEELSDDQVEAMVSLLSGITDCIDEVDSEEDLGRVLLSKDRRLQARHHRLNKNYKRFPRHKRKRIFRRIASISKLRNRVRQINKLDRNSKNKVARIIRQTYRQKSKSNNYTNKSKIQEERVDEPSKNHSASESLSKRVNYPINRDFNNSYN